eukprot:4140864-Amphidinium_carterae.4
MPQPSGSDLYWMEQLGLVCSRTTQTWSPTATIYDCPICGQGFAASKMLYEHLVAHHRVGLEPNYLNEHSIGEVVSGINNLVMEKRFRFSTQIEKPKFFLTHDESKNAPKLLWIGAPRYDLGNFLTPATLGSERAPRLLDGYRSQPTRLLNSRNPSGDLIGRVREMLHTGTGSLIPVAMTSKLWWDKLDSDGALGVHVRAPEQYQGAPGVHVGAPQQSFKTMAPWRNMVRAWEMRKYDLIRRAGWNEAQSKEDPHPAFMPLITQGAAMTPTMMIEGSWDTWSYADLMVPEAFYRMLKKDAFKYEKLEPRQIAVKWLTVIHPLLTSLGYTLRDAEGQMVVPLSGEDYYEKMATSYITSLLKTVKRPDATVLVNHEIFHSVAQAEDCADLLILWRWIAKKELWFDDEVKVPGFLDFKLDQRRKECDDGPSTVSKAFIRYQTLSLHGFLSRITDWSEHATVTPGTIFNLPIWLCQDKTVGDMKVPLQPFYYGRTPFTFVKSPVPTRKKEEESSTQVFDAKKRKIEPETEKGRTKKHADPPVKLSPREQPYISGGTARMESPRDVHGSR